MSFLHIDYKRYIFLMFMGFQISIFCQDNLNNNLEQPKDCNIQQYQRLYINR